ncbi:Uncharacterised protein [Candidatus Venteria ishoeyi]|uniref:Uncharacterized protein n=1 Tax=Candidatus Venteria ishoeyi TaxID=1899563 RepID=A0A1H6F798_9GAMM|nr:Uncharacterised protein [Candidatus Venteria ishoeyi]
MSEAVKHLTDGILPESFEVDKEIESLRDRFKELKKELNLNEDEAINSIEDLKEAQKKIQEENDLSDIINQKVLDIIARYKSIHHVKGESFQFFDELNKVAEIYEDSIKEIEQVKCEEWFEKLAENKHFFNYLIEAVEMRLKENFDQNELDDLLDNKLEKECEANNFKFFRALSRQIIYGNLAFGPDALPNPDGPSEEPEEELIQDEVTEEYVEENIEPKTEQEGTEFKLESLKKVGTSEKFTDQDGIKLKPEVKPDLESEPVSIDDTDSELLEEK